MPRCRGPQPSECIADADHAEVVTIASRNSDQLSRATPFQRSIVAESAGDPLTANIKQFATLGGTDFLILEKLKRRVSSKPSGHTMFEEGMACDHVSILIEGVACRYRILADGRRQILGFVFPGDICDRHFAMIGTIDHSVALLTDGRVATVPAAEFAGETGSSAAISKALGMTDLLEKSILRQWLLNMAQRSALQRLSHFLCEYVIRMQRVGQHDSTGAVPFGINQQALGDTLGMTQVHVNRMVQHLRLSGLVELRKRELRLLDEDRLAALGMFDGRYLRVHEKNRS